MISPLYAPRAPALIKGLARIRVPADIAAPIPALPPVNKVNPISAKDIGLSAPSITSAVNAWTILFSVWFCLNPRTSVPKK